MAFFYLPQLKIAADHAPEGIDELLTPAIAAELKISPAQIATYRIVGKSIDSRRGTPQLLYKLLIEGQNLPLDLAGEKDLAQLTPAQLELPTSSLTHPLVVGTGPGGIFGALALALAGCRPVVLDRGPQVEARVTQQEKFLATRQLDPENNLLIGEGGAGTFSDGKLYTGTRDPRRRFIIEQFIAAGAPPEIAYLSRPHIGSDRLRQCAVKLRQKIVELGGEFHFNTAVTDLIIRDGRCRGVITASGEKWEAPAVLISPGLGGRALVQTLQHYVEWLPKPFQIGCRIEHPQEFIDQAQYRLPNRPAALGAAEYHMVSRPPQGWSVSTFCMCPGGTVVNASAWENHSCTNGMSNYARDGEFANGCLIATLPVNYFSSTAQAYQEIDRLERQLFVAGGGNYTFPAQDARAFLRGEKTLTLTRTSAPVGLIPGRLDQLLLPEHAQALKAALKFFDRHHPGFIRYGKLIGLESCVSAPLRFVRTPEGSSTLRGLYLAGEGSGAAGGIISAAADGIKCAEALLQAEL